MNGHFIVLLCSSLFFLELISTENFKTGLTCPSDKTLKLRGAGSSFPSKVYEAAGPAYASFRAWTRRIDFEYFSKNSGHGKKQITRGKVMFAATESLLSAEQKANHSQLITFPTVSGALVIIYNLPNVHDLNLSMDVVTEIYLGNITKWNADPIQDLNPNAVLPDKTILPVARQDNGGDTEIFTAGLSSFSTHWNWTHGTFLSPNFEDGVCCKSASWPKGVIKYYGRQTNGMVGVVASVPFTIGYAPYPSARDFNVTFASLKNKAGVLTQPTPEAAIAAMDYFLGKNSGGVEIGLVGAKSPKAYPLISFSYIILNSTTSPDIDCCTMAEMVGFVDWLFYDSENYKIKENDLDPLSNLTKDRVTRDFLKAITCDGYNLYDEYQSSKIEPIPPLFSTVDIVLLILAASILLVVLLVSSYVVYQRRVGLAKISLWMIGSDEIQAIDESGSPKNFKKSLITLSSSRSKSRSSSRTDDTQSVLMSLSHLKWYKRVTYDGDIFFLLPFNVYRHPRKWSRPMKICMSNFKLSMNHHNLLGIMGVVEMGPELYILSQHAEKGCLHYVLQTTPYTLSPEILFSLSLNVTEGLIYLHKHKIVHGTLSSLTAYIDSSWNLKLADWARSELLKIEEDWKSDAWGRLTPHPEDDGTMIKMMYMDGQVVLDPNRVDTHADSFSLGLILLEIFTQETPYYTELSEGTITVTDILESKFTSGRNLAPAIPQKIPPGTVSVTIENLTDSDRGSRMTPKAVNLALRKARPSKMGIVDIMMKTMEKYTANLEELVKERTVDLEQATGRLEDLLSEVLPPQIAQKLFRGEAVEPEFFENVTIYFSDIVGFTKISAKSTPLEVMGFLDDLWILFDKVLDQFDVYKVDTIGDAYMVASDECRKFKFRHLPNEKLLIRIGANSGPVTTGVVGSKMPQYCVFGDTVNTASRMESTSETMRIQVSDSTYQILTNNFPQFQLQYRGEIPMKGKGDMKTYWLLSGGADDSNPSKLEDVETILIS